MKINIQLVFACLLSTWSTGLCAQMSNGGFEANSGIPNALGQYFKANGWGNANSAVAKPDYFHYAAPASCDLPETPMAQVDAFSGSSVMGMLLCGRPGTDQRVYLSYDFNTPMLAGQKYAVSFRVTNGAKTLVSNAGLGVNKLGVALTSSPLSQTNYEPISIVPNFEVEEVLYTNEWKYYSFVITPSNDLHHLTIGVFGDDSDKQIEIREGVDPAYAYAFFDEIKILKVPSNFQPIEEHPDRNDHNDHEVAIDSPNSNEPWFIPNSFTPSAGDLINNVFKPVANRVDHWEFSVFNLWGERMFMTTDINEGWEGNYAGKPCENGSYIWRVVYIDPLADDPKATCIKQGTFTLLR